MDSVVLPATGVPVGIDTVGTTKVQIVKLDAGAAGVSLPVNAANPLPVSVTFPTTQAISGTVALDSTALSALTAAATPTTQAVSGPLTDTQLRATAVPVSGTFYPTTQPVSGPVTDAQLRASAVPVSGTFYQATQPISASALPLPSGAATEAGNLASILAKLPATPATAAGQASILAALPASLGAKTGATSLSIVPASDAAYVLGASEAHIGQVAGSTSIVSATFARPADTTAYTALDTLSTSTSAPAVLTFNNAARVSAGSGYAVKACLETDQTANTARYRLHLFNAAPTAINDNSPFTLLWASRTGYVGYLDFDAMTTEGTGSTAAASLNASARLGFVCASGDRNLYGILETKDSFTPASAQNFFVELTIESN